MFTVQEIIEFTKGSLIIGDPQQTIRGFSLDSREISPQSLFIARRGENIDTHTFLLEIIEKFTHITLLLEPHWRDHLSLDKYLTKIKERNLTFIEVSHSDKTIYSWARQYRLSLHSLTLIAITGSVGKSTVKELTASLFEQQYKTYHTPKNKNASLGLAISLLSIPRNYQFAIIEIGIDHIGEMEHLASIASPTTALITNINETHLELLKDKETIAREKAKIYENLPREGYAFIPYNSPLKEILLNQSTLAQYSFYGESLPYQLSIIDNHLQGLTVRTKEKEEIALPLIGKHHIHNLCASLSLAEKYKLTETSIIKGLKSFQILQERGELFITEKSHYQIIQDFYNSSPASVKALLETLKSVEGKKIVILGDMLELGESAEELHKEIGLSSLELKNSYFFFFGTLMEHAYRVFNNSQISFWTKNYEELEKNLLNLLEKNTIIAIKGSRGMKLERINNTIIQLEKQENSFF